MGIAILLAGGSGVRMGASEPKQFLELAGEEIWVRTTKAFQSVPEIREIILSCRKDYMERMRNGVVRHGLHKVSHVVAGGKERYHSAFAGLEACACGDDEKILICDVVRPCIVPEVIKRVVLALDDFKACDTGVPVTETLFEVSGGRIINVPDRSRFYLGQGPEGFRYGIVRTALADYIASGKTGKTNISGIVTAHFADVELGFVLGSEGNIKITTFHDMDVAAVTLFKISNLGQQYSL